MVRCLILISASLCVVSAVRTDIKKVTEAMKENDQDEVETLNEEGTTSGSCCACKVGAGLTEGLTCLNNPGPTKGCYADWTSNESSIQFGIYKTTGVGSICKGSMMVGSQKFACWSRDDSVKSGQDNRSFREQCASSLMTFPAKKGSLAEVSAHESIKVQNEALEEAAVEAKTHSKEENAKAALHVETEGEEGTTSGGCCACKVGSGLTEGFTCLTNPGPTTGCYENWALNASSIQYGIYKKTGIGSFCKGSMMKGSQKFACWSRDDSVKSGVDNRSFREQCASRLMSFPAKKGSLAEVSAQEEAQAQNEALK